MNDIQKKNVCDILDSSGVDLRNALYVRFRNLNLVSLRSEDYQPLDRTFATIQEGIWTSDDPEFDYDKLKTDTYEALLDGRRAENEEPEAYVGESEAVERDRAVIDFTIDWLRCILEKDVNE